MLKMIQTSRKGVENKYKGLITSKEGYKNYRKNFRGTIDRHEYNRILRKYFENVSEFVLNGGDYKIPGGLGTIRIIKVDGDFKKAKVDWKTTKELWARDDEAKDSKQLVYFLNEHSDYSYYRFYWKKGICKNIKYVTFIAARHNTRGLSKLVKEENKDYFKK